MNNNRTHKRQQNERVSVFRIRGEVRSGTQTPFSILDQDFIITDDTWIVGNIGLGKIATVYGVLKPGLGRVATKITIGL